MMNVRRRLWAFLVSAIAASLGGSALVCVTGLLASEERYDVTTILDGFLSMSLLFLPFVLIGGVFAFGIGQLVPARVNRSIFLTIGSLAGATVAAAIFLTLSGSVSWIIVLAGAGSGLAAACVWERMVRSRELTHA
jgi:hypothetical protein